MKFSSEKTLLQSAISVAARAVSAKSSIPALEGILLNVTHQLELTGYNTETGIKTHLGAEIEEEGSLVLPARLFGEIVRKLPDGIVELSSQGNLVNITCGQSKFNIMAMDAEDFPLLPEVEDNFRVSVPQRDLASMIRQTLFAVSDNDARPIHTGSLFEVEPGNLTVVSVDGYRLALRREPLPDYQGAAFSFVSPKGALNEVEKICGDTDEVAKIYLGERHILFEIEDTILVTRRLEGEFLSYRQTIPRNNTVKIVGQTKELIATIDRVSLIISDKLKSPLRCHFGDGTLHITTRTGIGDASDHCPVDGNGDGLEIGFNNRYLMEALKAASTEEVRMELSTGVAPCIIVPNEETESFLYMVLPVRMRSGE